MKEKTEDVERLKDESNSWKIWGWVCFVSVVVLLLVSGYVYMFWSSVGAFFPTEGSTDIREQYALLGDAFGWVIGSLFSFVSVVLLIITLRQNQKVLDINSKELELSRIELGRSAQELELSREELHRSAEALENQLVQSDVQHLTAVVLEMIRSLREVDVDKSLLKDLSVLLKGEKTNVSTAIAREGEEYSLYSTVFDQLLLQNKRAKSLFSQVDTIYDFIDKFSNPEAREQLLFLANTSIDKVLLMIALFRTYMSFDLDKVDRLKSMIEVPYIEHLCLSFVNPGSKPLELFLWGITEIDNPALNSDIDDMIEKRYLNCRSALILAGYIGQYKNVLVTYGCSPDLIARFEIFESALKEKSKLT